MYSAINDILEIMFVANILAFVLYAYDKHLAIYKKFRIPEVLLYAVAFLGGAFGALCAMVFFRHKTAHTGFLVCVPLFVILQLTLLILIKIGVF